MLERETCEDGKVTHGFLVAVEVKPIIHPSVVAELLKEYLERWGSKTDVEYIGKIDCYEEGE